MTAGFSRSVQLAMAFYAHFGSRRIGESGRPAIKL